MQVLIGLFLLYISIEADLLGAAHTQKRNIYTEQEDIIISKLPTYSRMQHNQCEHHTENYIYFRCHLIGRLKLRVLSGLILGVAV